MPINKKSDYDDDDDDDGGAGGNSNSTTVETYTDRQCTAYSIAAFRAICLAY